MPVFKQILKILEKTVEEEHPYFIKALTNYSSLLRKMQRNAEAKEIETCAQAIHDRIAQRNMVTFLFFYHI